MTYKVIISDSAFKDLESAKSFIAADNIDAANSYISKILTRVESLSKFPYRGMLINNSVFDYAKARYLICLNHVAIYQINELAKCVYVLRVLSHFQKWEDIINKDLLNKEEILIEGEDLCISKMNQSMYYDVYRNSLDDNNKKYVPDEVFNSLEEASEVVDQIINNYDSDCGPFVYAIIRKKDRVNVGYVQLIKLNDDWEIGYHVAKIFNGQGYATKAVKLFLEYIFRQTKVRRIYGIVLANNKASRKVLAKCGFKVIYEGDGIYQGSRRKIVKTIKELGKKCN